MPECTNPVQCQTAKREECTCGCGGANHSILRAGLESKDPEVHKQAEEKLEELKQHQVVLKKLKRKERKQKRAEKRKAETKVST